MVTMRKNSGRGRGKVKLLYRFIVQAEEVLRTDGFSFGTYQREVWAPSKDAAVKLHPCSGGPTRIIVQKVRQVGGKRPTEVQDGA